MKLPILSRRAALQGLSVSFAAAFTPGGSAPRERETRASSSSFCAARLTD